MEEIDLRKNRVRYLRLTHLIRTQRELARAIGLSESTLSDIEKNKTPLGLVNVMKFVKVFDCSIDDLFEKKDK